MHVFVTGATGLIGFAIVNELIAAGHEVTGLARSEASGKKLIQAGARVSIGLLPQDSARATWCSPRHLSRWGARRNR
jgi:nucleoside-diphosphate-sugar epimerase